MSTPYHRAPHYEGLDPTSAAPNAALLIDFDNVTMGMRSDLSKELKNLLQTDVIKGKVTVQRAYADWRRYPQYIVPLSEASVDLIFAPAYGSSKKNATDIRMAIDGMELVFIRPEIGTYILLTGDSDFSSLVLKLKEYGKYVIGVGIQESSSDILVQNCDEYYSYTSLSGLQKASDAAGKPTDPWQLVERAVEKMVARSDVMRSDRLKQVMIELDANFDEGNFGFSKFSKFLAEAASRKLVGLQKLENGQYEILAEGKRGRRAGSRDNRRDRDESRRRGGRRGRDRVRRDERPDEAPAAEETAVDTAPVAEFTEAPTNGSDHDDPLENAYRVLVTALERHAENGRNDVRDSDVKRKILEVSPGFDEGELGFGKFSRFLKQAAEHGVISLTQLDTGNHQVTLAEGKTSEGGRLSPEPGSEPEPAEERRWELVSGKGRRQPYRSQSDLVETKPEEEDAPEARIDSGRTEISDAEPIRGMGPRSGTRARPTAGLTLLEGQVIGTSAPSAPSTESVDVAQLGLPRDAGAIVQYLTNSYRGVGEKTAEQLVEAFGPEIFHVFASEPERLQAVVPRRAEAVLEAWRADLARRTDGAPSDGGDSDERSGRRTRGRRGGNGHE